MIINKKQKIYSRVDFAVSADHGRKIKENKKTKKYLDLAREQRMLWDMSVTALSILIGALWMVPKVIEKGVGRVENRTTNRDIQTITLLRLVRILTRVLVTYVELLSFRLQWKYISVSCWKKNLAVTKIKIIIVKSLGIIQENPENKVSELEMQERIRTIRTKTFIRPAKEKSCRAEETLYRSGSSEGHSLVRMRKH